MKKTKKIQAKSDAPVEGVISTDGIIPRRRYYVSEFGLLEVSTFRKGRTGDKYETDVQYEPMYCPYAVKDGFTENCNDKCAQWMEDRQDRCPEPGKPASVTIRRGCIHDTDYNYILALDGRIVRKDFNEDA